MKSSAVILLAPLRRVLLGHESKLVTLRFALPEHQLNGLPPGVPRSDHAALKHGQDLRTHELHRVVFRIVRRRKQDSVCHKRPVHPPMKPRKHAMRLLADGSYAAESHVGENAVSHFHELVDQPSRQIALANSTAYLGCAALTDEQYRGVPCLQRENPTRPLAGNTLVDDPAHLSADLLQIRIGRIDNEHAKPATRRGVLLFDSTNDPRRHVAARSLFQLPIEN